MNLIVFACEARYQFIPSIWITILLILYEGLLGGACYVNAFYSIYNEVTLSFLRIVFHLSLSLPTGYYPTISISIMRLINSKLIHHLNITSSSGCSKFSRKILTIVYGDYLALLKILLLYSIVVLFLNYVTFWPTLYLLHSLQQ